MRPLLMVVLVAAAAPVLAQIGAIEPAGSIQNSGSSLDMAGDPDRPPAHPLMGGSDLGSPIGCIPTKHIRKIEIVSDKIIMFDVAGQWYRTTLPQRCTGLKPDSGLILPGGSKLCSTDSLRFDNAAPAKGGSCGLGAFTPYQPPAH